MDKKWINETIEKLDKKLSRTAVEYTNYIPTSADENGKFTTNFENLVNEWTAGFWGGLMWIMYKHTGKEIYRQTAHNSEVLLDRALKNYEGLDHDLGFIWDLTAGESYRQTGDPDSKVRMLYAADVLAGRYNIKGGYINAWNDKVGDMDIWGTGSKQGYAIIDCMMNLPLLYHASEVLKRDRFKYIAEMHADKTMANHIRSDGSVNHILNYDVETGELNEILGGQGMEAGSSWSRGQAWAIYGFALNYAEAKKVEYLDIAKRVAHYFIACVCDDYIPKADFRSPDEPRKIDTSAGMIAAAGMLEISKHVPKYEKNLYISNAYKIVRAITEKYADWSDKTDPIITNGMVKYTPDEDQAYLNYSDYYFADALYRLEEIANNSED